MGGYSFERAYAELEWFLEDDRWKTVGPGFSDINALLGTLNFADFRIGAERRKQIASRLAAIEASQRATARMLGVNPETVRRDLGAANAASPPEKPNEIRSENGPPAANAAPPSGDTPAAPTGLLQSPEVTASAARHMGELQAAIGSAAGVPEDKECEKGAESERPPAADPDEGAEARKRVHEEIIADKLRETQEQEAAWSIRCDLYDFYLAVEDLPPEMAAKNLRHDPAEAIAWARHARPASQHHAAREYALRLPIVFCRSG